MLQFTDCPNLRETQPMILAVSGKETWLILGLSTEISSYLSVIPKPVTSQYRLLAINELITSVLVPYSETCCLQLNVSTSS